MTKPIAKKAPKKNKEGKINISHPSRNVCVVDFPYVHEGWEQWILLTSDRHHDSKWCDRGLEREHLDEMVRRDGYCIDVGDLFDVMQGRYDPRRTYRDLRPEFTVENYLDEVVKDADPFFAPYASRFLVIGRGNHDQSILKNNGVDLVSNLVHRLNSEHGGNIQAGGYGGWVRFMFLIGGTQRQSFRLKYFHGSGGGGPVTRGVIQTNRQAVFLPDANAVVNGHTHDSWLVPIQRERLTHSDVVTSDIQHHVRTSTYKDEYRDGADGWHVETGKPPKPIGAVWMRFFYRNGAVEVEFTQALKNGFDAVEK
jgi:hypothetical protein